LKRNSPLQLVGDSIDQQVENILKRTNHSRFIAIAIENFTNVKLQEPKWFLSSGLEASRIVTIEPGKAGIVAFKNVSYSFTGVSGVLTFRIEGTDKRFAIVFQVPYVYGVCENWYNLNIIQMKAIVDQELFDTLISWNANPVQAGELERDEFNFHMKGYMEDKPVTKLRVEIRGEVPKLGPNQLVSLLFV
jgi:hypothetical protein